MARPLRMEFPGAVYHVMARGSQGQRIYADDADREMLARDAGSSHIKPYQAT